MSNHTDREFGAEVYGQGKTYFDDVAMDNLMEAFLELTAMVWTYRDRNIILEKVLQDIIGKDKDINLQYLVEQYRPTAEENAERKKEREQFVNSVFASFSKRPK
ncbi:hypothetical protein AB6T38_08780 [Aliiglaciecola sp. SL4]|uniref:hypothetical protein n=1 Tax=Aliiglaciecola sp. SL4 TaxID=3239806 RepID=UPI00355AE495